MSPLISELKLKLGLEKKVYAQLIEKHVDVQYEAVRITYIKKPATYTPDFLLPNGIFIETKGRFLAADRAKHLLIKSQHPELDIRFVFSNSKAKIPNKKKKGPETTYGEWCMHFGFKYADKFIPQEWIEECQSYKYSQTKTNGK